MTAIELTKTWVVAFPLEEMKSRPGVKLTTAVLVY